MEQSQEQNPVQGNQQQAGQTQNNKLQMPSTNLVWAILATLFCCLPTGIYAIVRAAKVESLYVSGYYEESLRASNDALKWSIISVCLSVVSWLVYFVLSLLGLVASAF